MMKTRTLGSTGLEVSVIGLGTYQFSGEWGKTFTPEDAAAIIDTAEECGIDFVDTAECYGDHLAERLIGGVLKGTRRDRWVVATKFGHRNLGPMTLEDQWEPDQVQAQLERSLSALGTDRVDLYQFHSGSDAQFDNDALWTRLDKLKRDGKVGHLGLSLQAGLMMRGELHQMEAAKERGVEVVQVLYNRLTRMAEETLAPLCRRENIGAMARIPLAKGFLSGKYERGATFPADDLRSRDSPELINRLFDELETARNEVPEGVPMARWALAWALRDPWIATVIPGAKTPDQVRANALAADLLED